MFCYNRHAFFSFSLPLIDAAFLLSESDQFSFYRMMLFSEPAKWKSSEYQPNSGNGIIVETPKKDFSVKQDRQEYSRTTLNEL